jgi:hypothetical protein
MEKFDVYDLVKKIIGEINPIGETNADEERFENLKTMTELVDMLLDDIDRVSFKNRDKAEYSMKRASDFANRFLISIKAINPR